MGSHGTNNILQTALLCPRSLQIRSDQIVAGKYVDLSNLQAANLQLQQKDSEPQLLFNRRLVLTSPLKRQRRKIEDIAAWMEAFSIFALVLVTHFPHRWKDLLQYQLLILRRFHHFSGKV